MLAWASGFETGTANELRSQQKRWRTRRRDRTCLLIAFGINERGLREIIVSGRAKMVETTYADGGFGIDRTLPNGTREPICGWRAAA